jgi:L-alanine-DL-glutamate epimerase-like enolase superfamily enzyme
MLTSVSEHRVLIERNAVDVIQPDVPRVGGITRFLQIATLADDNGLRMAPHFVMEIHIHMAAAYARDVWVEHFEWLEPLFNERLEIRDGRMIVPDRPGLGFSLSEQAASWTLETVEVGKRP